MTKTYLYRLFTIDNELLYVGITKDLFTRLSTHRSWQSWWPDVDHYSVKEYFNREEAEQAEALAIATENPEHNQHPGVALSTSQLSLESAHRAKRRIDLPPGEKEYLGSLNGEAAYSRAAELKRAGWSVIVINAAMRVTPDRNSLRTKLRFHINDVTGVPVPTPPDNREQERRQRAVPRSFLTESEQSAIREYAKYSAKLRPQYTDEHPVAIKVNEYRRLIVEVHHRGVHIGDIAEAAGRNRSSINRLYKEGLELTQEEPRRKRPRK